MVAAVHREAWQGSVPASLEDTSASSHSPGGGWKWPAHGHCRQRCRYGLYGVLAKGPGKEEKRFHCQLSHMSGGITDLHLHTYPICEMGTTVSVTSLWSCPTP